MTLAPHAAAIALTAFLASAVEMVEALTIVLAVGITRGWARALGAAACAVAALAAVVALAGPRLPALAENHWVKLVVGLVALYVGVTWLRKAVLRAAGRKALRDEDAAFRRELEALARESGREAFATAFTGVLTEGIEVVAIVLALGSGTALTLAAASTGAAVALVAVVAIGLIVHRPLARVPENAMKYAVGVMVTAFGIYWTGSGLTLPWPAQDLALFYLAAAVLAIAAACTARLRRALPA
ncbi:MAG: hypothetical protein JOZ24_07310 [Candidatus Eremiobacteraeota bacterium]|nr:hypothetical protein [Candidatus Eremiobacteraeota bacterium]